MTREPSIHIKRSDLLKILNKHFRCDTETINDILKDAHKLSISHRSIVATNNKIKTKVEKIANSNIGDATLLADIFYATRVKQKHIGVKKINISDMAWADVKNLVPLVNEYCRLNDLDKREGYILYVSTGFELMKQQKKANYQFAAKWMYQRSDNILSTLEGTKHLRDDVTPHETLAIHNVYVKQVAERTGIHQTYMKNASTAVHFIEAKKQANELNVDYDTYIEAQFYALEFCSGVPGIKDLHGEKASTRLIKYVSEMGINLKPSSTSNTHVDWSQFKK